MAYNNRGIVQLSDDRQVVVEAEHLGEIRVTVVGGLRPANATRNWGSYEIRHRTWEEWERENSAQLCEEEWLKFILDFDDIFMTNYCGYWMRGMEWDKKLGWLVFEHGGEVRAPKETNNDVMELWRSGKPLPKRWHRLDRAAVVRAYAEGVLLKGANWYEAADTDATTYDVVIQRALFGEEKYG